MKKMMTIAMAAIMTLGVSVSVYAYRSQPSAGASQSATEVTTVRSSAQGGGVCTHVLCSCKSFRNGGASGAKCANCGHMEFIHK